jgi:alkylation response protein AidB-like acyl-CoA dehydrogenase
VNLDLTEEQALIQRTARDYAERELMPRAAARDRVGEFPESELRALAQLGLLGVTVPEKYGGVGAGAVAYALALQELARGDASVSVAVSVTNMVAELIATFGSEEQRAEHLPRLVGGDYLCASFALSEPEAGSDARALSSRAVPDGDGFKLTGTKQWVTSGDRSGLLVVWAATDTSGPRAKLSAFIVPRAASGLSVTRVEQKMGLRGSSTVQLCFDEVRLPRNALLGSFGDGYRLALTALAGGRISIGAQATGLARFALETAHNYARERKAFGVPIIQHQAIGNMLADSATAVEAASLLTARAAWAKERGMAYGGLAARAKLFASEMVSRVCDTAIQIHGGYGYTTDFPLERVYRDARVTRIYEGTSEIQRIIIARDLMKER